MAINVGVGDLVFALAGADCMVASRPTGLDRFRTDAPVDVRVQVSCGREPQSVWERSELLSLDVDASAGLVSIVRTEGSAWFDLGRRSAAVNLRGPWTRALESFLSTAAQVYSLTLGRGLVLHAASVERNGAGVAFTGRSGAGKSTAARLAGQRGARTIAEDMSYISLGAGGSASICTLPFWQRGGTEPDPERIDLRRVCFLHQASRDAVVELPAREQVRRILQVVTIGVRHRLLMECAFDAAQRLVASTPVVDLHFRKSSAFWDLMEDHEPQ